MTHGTTGTRSTFDLELLVADFASALAEVDRSGKPHKHFQPGIGPYGETEAVREALLVLKATTPERYSSARICRHPDVLIEGSWRVEVKILRPFGDNGRPAENWSQNLLHPYRGNTGLLGDCLGLIESDGDERKAVLVFGFEHEPAQTALEPCFRGFEILADRLLGIRLSERVVVRVPDLIHPVHQVLIVVGWEVLGRDPGSTGVRLG